MTANQRRPGFRLPWSSDSEEPAAEGDTSATIEPAVPADASETAPATTPAGESSATVEPPAGAAADVTPSPEDSMTDPASAREASTADVSGSSSEAATDQGPAPAAAAPEMSGTPAATTRVGTLDAAAGPARNGARDPIDPEASPDFLRDLVAAMRKVADDARAAGIAEIRTRSDERAAQLEGEAESRRNELRSRADAEIAGVGEWAKAEAERIRREAEQRVASRRSLLEEQLAAETARTEAETHALRARVEEYERELDAYHAQLGEIADPAAFAAAAKRMPRPPLLDAEAPVAPVEAPPAAEVSPTATGTGAAPAPREATSTGATSEATKPDAGTEPMMGADTLAARIAALGAPVAPEPPASTSAPEPVADVAPATLPAPETPAATAAAAPAPAAPAPAAPVTTETTTTEIVVKGLGSFGAITGFRQALSGVEGIDAVALSLGQTGEFIFRASHRAGVDLPAAISQLEGDGANVESRAEGGYVVTLDRAR